MINAQASKRTQLLATQAMTNSATLTANLDTKGSGYAVVTMNFAIENSTTGIGATIAFTESDDTVVTNFGTFDTDFAITGADGDLTAAKIICFQVNLVGRKRYMRLSVSSGTNGTHDNLIVGAIAELSRLEVMPANAAAMVGSGDVIALG